MRRSARRKTEQLLQLEGLNLKALSTAGLRNCNCLLSSHFIFLLCLLIVCLSRVLAALLQHILCCRLIFALRARLLYCPCCGWIWVECSLRAVEKLIKFHKYYIFFVCLQLSWGGKKSGLVSNFIEALWQLQTWFKFCYNVETQNGMTESILLYSGY